MPLASEILDFDGYRSIIIGNDYRIPITITATGLSLVGVSANCRIKKYYDSPIIYSPQVEFIDRMRGKIALIFKKDTAIIPSGIYQYNLQLTLVNGDYYTPFLGRIEFVGNAALSKL